MTTTTNTTRTFGNIGGPKGHTTTTVTAPSGHPSTYTCACGAIFYARIQLSDHLEAVRPR